MAELFRVKGIEDAEALGINAAQLFRISSTEYIKLYPGVLEALAQLRQKGCRLWLLSNAQRIFTAFELQHLGLGEQLDGIYISSDYRCRKPDTRFYQALVDEQGLDIKRCLMIGNDRQTDIAGAKKLGMATLYMHTNLTPADQAPADPALYPSPALQHMEYEGEDWSILCKLIEGIV